MTVLPYLLINIFFNRFGSGYFHKSQQKNNSVGVSIFSLITGSIKGFFQPKAAIITTLIDIFCFVYIASFIFVLR